MNSFLPVRLAPGVGFAATVLFALSPGHAQPTQPANAETIVLNPFDVTAGNTKGYMATNTISGTAMNTPLKEVPMTINVITAELLADMVPADLIAAMTFTMPRSPRRTASPSPIAAMRLRSAASATAMCSSTALPVATSSRHR